MHRRACSLVYCRGRAERLESRGMDANAEPDELVVPRDERLVGRLQRSHVPFVQRQPEPARRFPVVDSMWSERYQEDTIRSTRGSTPGQPGDDRGLIAPVVYTGTPRTELNSHRSDTSIEADQGSIFSMTQRVARPMKFAAFISLIVSVAVLFAACAGAVGPKGDPGAAGTDGTDGQGWRTGARACRACRASRGHPPLQVKFDAATYPVYVNNGTTADSAGDPLMVDLSELFSGRH